MKSSGHEAPAAAAVRQRAAPPGCPDACRAPATARGAPGPAALHARPPPRASQPRGRATSTRILLACAALAMAVGLGYLGATVYPLSRKYGHEVLYYLVAPAWFVRLTEAPPTEAPTSHEGARRVGRFWVRTLSESPNVTLVHNFLTPRECDELRRLGELLGLGGSESSPGRVASARTHVRNNGDGGLRAAIIDRVYRLANSGEGFKIRPDLVGAVNESLVPVAVDRAYGVMRRAERLLSLPMEAMEDPYIKRCAETGLVLPLRSLSLPLSRPVTHSPARSRSQVRARAGLLAAPRQLRPGARERQVGDAAGVPRRHRPRRRDGVHEAEAARAPAEGHGDRVGQLRAPGRARGGHQARRGVGRATGRLPRGAGGRRAGDLPGPAGGRARAAALLRGPRRPEPPPGPPGRPGGRQVDALHLYAPGATHPHDGPRPGAPLSPPRRPGARQRS